MCEPVTVMTAVTLASTAFQIKNQLDQGRYQKGVSRYNARVAQNQAEEVRNAGNEAENIQRLKTARFLATQRAKLGASGVQIDSGSALQLQTDTLTLGEADALRIRSNVDNQVNALRTGSELTLAQGNAAGVAAGNEAVGTLLSGSAAVLNTGVADKWFTPSSSANQIQDQTGFAGGVDGVLSGEEFATF